jgi:hypothetical protein
MSYHFLQSEVDGIGRNTKVVQRMLEQAKQ